MTLIWGNNVRIRNRLYHLVRATALTIWFTCLVAFGSVFPDTDHLFGEGERTWGHDYWVVLAVFLLGMGATYLCRYYWIRILRRKLSG